MDEAERENLKRIRNQIYGSHKTKQFIRGRFVRHVIDAKDFGVDQ